MAADKGEINVGDRVKHPKLGEGDVLDIHPLGEETCAVISFEQLGQKKVILKYAKLKVVRPEDEEEVEAEEEES
jgi:DNA helicase-2/ATP-dependent DNA helicase PcrA